MSNLPSPTSTNGNSPIPHQEQNTNVIMPFFQKYDPSSSVPWTESPNPTPEAYQETKLTATQPTEATRKKHRQEERQSLAVTFLPFRCPSRHRAIKGASQLGGQFPQGSKEPPCSLACMCHPPLQGKLPIQPYSRQGVSLPPQSDLSPKFHENTGPFTQNL